MTILFIYNECSIKNNKGYGEKLDDTQDHKCRTIIVVHGRGLLFMKGLRATARIICKVGYGNESVLISDREITGWELAFKW